MDASHTGSTDAAASLAFLYGRINYERSPPRSPRQPGLNLKRMRELVARLGNPQEAAPIVHIAGTKGKGSTAAMIASVLTAAGYRTGLYTSPHLERLEERINIDGSICSPQELVDLVDALRPVVCEMDREAGQRGGHGPTFFEITTAMAMLQFARRRVDAVVLEVGLGGRLDSTNICSPAVTVITTIGLDHVRQLGGTLAAIAREKAGIIKPGIPLISGVTQPEPQAVIKGVAAEQRAPACFLGDDFDFEYWAPQAVDRGEPTAGRLDYRRLDGEGRRLEGVRLGMLGRHQAINASVAIATLQQLQSLGWEITESALRRGLAGAHCRGRVEILSRRPTIVLDTAHNDSSIEALVAAIDESFAAPRRILLFAATRDKDLRGMLLRLLPKFETIILTRYVENPRGVPPEELKAAVDEIVGSGVIQPAPLVRVCDRPTEAWNLCQSLMTPEHLVCVAGSFFLAAEIRPLISPVQVAPTYRAPEPSLISNVRND